MTTRGEKTKLELTWIGKENRPRLELRILRKDMNGAERDMAKRYEGDKRVMRGKLERAQNNSASFYNKMSKKGD